MYHPHSNHNRNMQRNCVSGAAVDPAATRRVGFYEDFLLGGVAAGVAKTAAAPVERVKLLIQNQDEMMKAGRLASPYRGVADCASRVVQQEGTLSLWRGNTANVIRYFPTQALNFAFKDYYQHVLKVAQVGTSHSKMSALSGNMLSGALAGASSLVFVYSLDYVRTRLANDALDARRGAARQFSGMGDVYLKTLRSDGLAGLYRGFLVSCVGIVVYRGCYFGFFDTLKPMLSDGLQKNFFATFMLGWAVTIGAGLASYPFDTVRRRMMMTSGEVVKYGGSWDCFMQIIRNEGPASLFKGAGANILRSIAGAGALAGFDKLKDLYIRSQYADDAALAIAEAKRSGVLSANRAGEVLREAGLVVSDKTAERGKQLLSSARETSRSFNDMTSDFKGFFSKSSNSSVAASRSAAPSAASARSHEYIEARQAALQQHQQRRQAGDAGVVYEHVMLPSEWESRELTAQPSEQARRVSSQVDAGVTHEGLLRPSKLSPKSRGHFKAPLQPTFASKSVGKTWPKHDTEYEYPPESSAMDDKSWKQDAGFAQAAQPAPMQTKTWAKQDTEFEYPPQPADMPAVAAVSVVSIAVAQPIQDTEFEDYSGPISKPLARAPDRALHPHAQAKPETKPEAKPAKLAADDESMPAPLPIVVPDSGMPNLPGERHGAAFFIPWDQPAGSVIAPTPASPAPSPAIEPPAVHMMKSDSRAAKSMQQLAEHIDMMPGTVNELSTPDTGLPNLPGERHIAGFMLAEQPNVPMPSTIATDSHYLRAAHKPVSLQRHHDLLAALPKAPHHNLMASLPPPHIDTGYILGKMRAPQPDNGIPLDDLPSLPNERHVASFMHPAARVPASYVQSEEVSTVLPGPPLPNLHDERHGAEFIRLDQPETAMDPNAQLARATFESAAIPQLPSFTATSQRLSPPAVFKAESKHSSRDAIDNEMEYPTVMPAAVPLPDLREERHGSSFIPANEDTISSSHVPSLSSSTTAKAAKHHSPVIPADEIPAVLPVVEERQPVMEQKPASPQFLPVAEAVPIMAQTYTVPTIVEPEMEYGSSIFLSGTRSSPIQQEQTYHASEDNDIEGSEIMSDHQTQVSPVRRPPTPIRSFKEDVAPVPSLRAYEPANISVPRNPASVEIAGNQAHTNAAVGHKSPSLGDKLLSATSKVKDAIVYALTGATGEGEETEGSHPARFENATSAERSTEPPVAGAAILPGGSTIHTGDHMSAASDVQRAEAIPPVPLRTGISGSSKETGRSFTQMAKDIGQSLKETFTGSSGSDSAHHDESATTRRDNPPGRETAPQPPAMHRDYREAGMEVSHAPGREGEIVAPTGERAAAGGFAIQREGALTATHTNQAARSDADFARYHMFSPTHERFLNEEHIRKSGEPPVPPPILAPEPLLGAMMPGPTAFAVPTPVVNVAVPNVRDPVRVAQADQPPMGPTEFAEGPVAIGTDITVTTAAQMPGVGHNYHGGAAIDRELIRAKERAAHDLVQANQLGEARPSANEFDNSNNAIASDTTSLAEPVSVDYLSPPSTTGPSSASSDRAASQSLVFGQPTRGNASPSSSFSSQGLSTMQPSGAHSFLPPQSSSIKSSPPVVVIQPPLGEVLSQQQVQSEARQPGLLLSSMNPQGIASASPGSVIGKAGNMGEGPDQVSGVARGSTTIFGHGLTSMNQGAFEAAAQNAPDPKASGSGGAGGLSHSAISGPQAYSDSNPNRFVSGSTREGRTLSQRTADWGSSIKGMFGSGSKAQDSSRARFNPPPSERSEIPDEPIAQSNSQATPAYERRYYREHVSYHERYDGQAPFDTGRAAAPASSLDYPGQQASSGWQQQQQQPALPQQSALPQHSALAQSEHSGYALGPGAPANQPDIQYRSPRTAQFPQPQQEQEQESSSSSWRMPRMTQQASQASRMPQQTSQASQTQSQDQGEAGGYARSQQYAGDEYMRQHQHQPSDDQRRVQGDQTSSRGQSSLQGAQPIPVEHRSSGPDWTSRYDRFGVLGSTREPSRSFTQMAKDVGQSLKETFGMSSAQSSEQATASSAAARRDNPPAREPSPVMGAGRNDGAGSPGSPVLSDYRTRELQVNTEPGREGEIVVPRTGERAGAGGIAIQRPHAVLEKTHTNQAARSDRPDTTAGERDLFPADRPVVVNKERVGNPMDWEGGNLFAANQPIAALQVPNVRDPRFNDRNLATKEEIEPIKHDVVVTTAVQQPGIGHNYHGGSAIDRDLVAHKEAAAETLIGTVGRENIGRVQEGEAWPVQQDMIQSAAILPSQAAASAVGGIATLPAAESLSGASTASLQGSPSPSRTSPGISSSASSPGNDWSEAAAGSAAVSSMPFEPSPLRKGGEYNKPFGASQSYDTPAYEGLGTSTQAQNPIYSWQEPSYISDRLGAEAVSTGLPSGLAAGQSSISNTVDSGAMGGMNASGLHSRLDSNLEAAGLQSMTSSGLDSPAWSSTSQASDNGKRSHWSEQAAALHSSAGSQPWSGGQDPSSGIALVNEYESPAAVGASSGPAVSSWSSGTSANEWPSATSAGSGIGSPQWKASDANWTTASGPAQPLEPGQLSEKDTPTSRTNLLGSARDEKPKGLGQRIKEVFTGHHSDSHATDTSAAAGSRDAAFHDAGAAAAASDVDHPKPIAPHGVTSSGDTREHGMLLNMEPGREGEIVRPGTGERAGCGAICIQREGALESTHNSQAARHDAKWISGPGLPGDGPIVINRERTGSPPNYQDDGALAESRPFGQVSQFPPTVPEMSHGTRDLSGGSAIDRELNDERLRAEKRQFDADKEPAPYDRETTDTTRSHLSASTRSPAAPGLTFSEKLKDTAHSVKTAIFGESKSDREELRGNPSGDRNENYQGLGLDRPVNTEQRSYFDTKEAPLPPADIEGARYDPVDPNTTRRMIIEEGSAEPVIYPSLDAAPDARDEHASESVGDKIKDAGHGIRDAVSSAITGHGAGTYSSRQTSSIGSANTSQFSEASQATERSDVRHQLAHPEYAAGNPNADSSANSITQRSSIIGSAKEGAMPGLASGTSSFKTPVQHPPPAGPGIDHTRQETVRPLAYDMGPLGIQQRVQTETFERKEAEHDRMVREAAVQDMERFVPPPAEEIAASAAAKDTFAAPVEKPMPLEPTSASRGIGAVPAQPVRENVDITQVQKEVPLDPSTDPLAPPEENPQHKSMFMEKLRETGSKVKEAIVVAFTGKNIDQNNALVPVGEAHPVELPLHAQPTVGTTAMPAGQPAPGNVESKKRTTLMGSSKDTSKTYREMGESAVARLGSKLKSRSPGEEEDFEQGSMPALDNTLQRNTNFPPGIERTGHPSDPGEAMPLKVKTREEAMHPNIKAGEESMLTHEDYAKQKSELTARNVDVPQERDPAKAAVEYIRETGQKIRDAVTGQATRDTSDTPYVSEATRAALRATWNESAAATGEVLRPSQQEIDETARATKPEFAKDYLGAAAIKARDIAGRTETAVSNAVHDAKEAIEDIPRATRDAAHELATDVERGYEKARDTAWGMERKARDKAEDLGDEAKRTANTLKADVERGYENTKADVERGYENTKDTARDLQHMARDKASEYGRDVADAGHRAAIRVREAGRELGEPIKPAVESVRDEFKNLGTATKDYLMREPAIVPETGPQRAIGIDTPENRIYGAETEVRPVVPGLLGTLGGAVKSALDSTKEAISHSITSTEEALGSIRDAAMDALHNAKESAKETLHIGHPTSETLDATKQASREALETSRDVTEEAGRYVKEAGAEAWDKSKAAGSEAARATNDTLKDTASRAGEAWESTKEKAAGAWEKAKEALPTSGEVDDSWKVKPSPTWEAAKAYAGAEVDRQKMAGKEAWETLKDSALEEWEGGKDALQQAWDKAKDIGHDVSERLTKATEPDDRLKYPPEERVEVIKLSGNRAILKPEVGPDIVDRTTMYTHQDTTQELGPLDKVWQKAMEFGKGVLNMSKDPTGREQAMHTFGQEGAERAALERELDMAGLSKEKTRVGEARPVLLEMEDPEPFLPGFEEG